MGRFKHHKYTYTGSTERACHVWELVGPEGGIHFRVIWFGQDEPVCGLEYHHSSRAKYRKDEAPDHVSCPLIGEPCWHDGTSLYARESVWPLIESDLRSANHDAIFRTLEHEYDLHFSTISGEG